MATAKIGALHVSLGLDSAQFTSGLAKSQSKLGSFGKAAGMAFAAVAAAGVAAGTALAYAVKASADHADALSKTAQKVGVTTEALSRLEWAAKLSDVSLEQLSGGLTRLSKNMADVATGSAGPAAIAFSALGIKVTDAAGQLRDSDQVFADVAEKFSRMENGATKTAVAVALFGRAGAEMIPMLNAGRRGLADMAAESDRLGQTISTKTGKAAEEFNDNITRMQAVLSGLSNKVMAEVVPSLANLTNTMASPEFQGAITATIGLITQLADVLARTAVLAFEVANILPKAVGGGEDGAVAAMQKDFAAMSPEDFRKKYQLGDVYADPAAASPAAAADDTGLKTLVVDLAAAAEAAKKAKDEFDPLRETMDELSYILTTARDPLQQLQYEMDALGALLNAKAIDWQEYGEAAQRAQLLAASSALGAVGQISGALSDLFKGNKAFAVANAVINTAEGITKALAQGGMWGFVGAAAVAASGAAQIGAILSSNPGTSKAPSVGSSAAPAMETPAAPSSGGGTAVNITLKGGGLYSRDNIEQMFSAINDALGDGFKLNLQGT